MLHILRVEITAPPRTRIEETQAWVRRALEDAAKPEFCLVRDCRAEQELPSAAEHREVITRWARRTSIRLPGQAPR